jgi:miniconductance mechanosensitive channel
MLVNPEKSTVSAAPKDLFEVQDLPSQQTLISLQDVHDYWINVLNTHPMLFGLVKAAILIVGSLLLYKCLNLAVKKIAPRYLSGVALSLFANRVYANILRYISAILIVQYSGFIQYESIEALSLLIGKAAIIFISGALAFSVFDAALDFSDSQGVTKRIPVKSLTQLGKVITSVVCFVVFVSLMIDKSPTYLIGSLGALSAVLMLVFRDSILGLVAGIQLTANRVVNIGDRVQTGEIEGNVEDISLTIVKIRNYDNTITSIPCHELVNKPLKNWALMDDKGRRIKRSISIDANSVSFISDDEMSKLAALRPLNKYLSQKFEELRAENELLSETEIINKRRLTNIGTFRIFIENYLKMNENIITDEALVVRQGQSSEKGIPIEIYCFAENNSWSDYEQVQSDIFDYIFAVLPLFGLRIFQLPTGYDLQSLSIK